MKILFWDCETTGLWVSRAPVGHPSQPDMVQLACKLIDTDTRQEHAALKILVKPTKPMDPKASEINGITQELLDTYGVSRRYAVAAYDGLARISDVTVAHNREFDQNIIDHAYTCEGIPLRPSQGFCTKDAATHLCKLAKFPYNGRTKPGYKWPTLQESYAILVKNTDFDIPTEALEDREWLKNIYADLVKRGGFEGAHDALVDVNAMIELYYALRNLGITPCARKAA